VRWLLAVLLLVPASAAAPLLVGVAPRLPGADAGDAFAVGCAATCDLGGWGVTDGETTWTFASGTHLEAGGTMWVVGNRTRWMELGGAIPALPEGAKPLRLADGGDDLRLVGTDGVVADAMAYGTGSVAGFTGSVPGASPGLVLERLRSGSGWRDTDSADDWRTPRMHRIGESNLDRPTFTVDWLTLYASPDSSFATLTSLIGGATERLHLHVYELRSAELVDALVAAKAAHPALDLQVLVDADPVGASAADRHASADALRRIQAAGGRAVLAGNGRFDDHHLKVLVADGAVAVQSENWVAAGVPQDPSWGNRGWGIVVHDRAAADWFARWMEADRDSWDAAPFDLASYDPSFHAPGREAPRTGEHAPAVPSKDVHGPFLVTPVVAPDQTQDPASDPIAAVAAAARHRLDVQQLDLSLAGHNALGWSGNDPLADSIAHAAAAGANARVQGAAPFSTSDTGNEEALAWLADHRAATQVFDGPGIATLHNKGIVSDDTVVVGSLNGNLHSRTQNREVDLVVQGGAAADYFDGLFNGDWTGGPAPRDWNAPLRDLHALPGAPWPILLALIGLVATGRRWS
jgi:hypothetical protein